jgi:hypothetical protein
MTNIRLAVTLGISIVVVFALVVIHDYTKPDCVEAQTCVPVLTDMQIQACQTAICNNCGTPQTCSVTVRPKQACFLTFVSIGDLGGGNDKAICRISGASVSASRADDGESQCGMVCINFI